MNSKYQQEVELFEKQIYELEKMNIYLKLANDVLDRGGQGQVPEPSYKTGLFYLTRPLLLGEAPHPLLNTLASPKSFTLGNVQMHLSLHSLNQDFPLLRREGLNR